MTFYPVFFFKFRFICARMELLKKVKILNFQVYFGSFYFYFTKKTFNHKRKQEKARENKKHNHIEHNRKHKIHKHKRTKLNI